MIKNNPIFLLAIRSIPLISRPIVLILEKSLIPLESSLQIIVMPISMLCLGFMAIPIHKNYYLSTKNKATEESKYLGLLIPIFGYGLIFSVILTFTVSTNSFLIFLIVIFCVVIEKMSDEICRYLEFQKKFIQWFSVQMLRNLWPIFVFIYILFSEGNYLFATFSFSGLTLFSVFVIMKKNFKNKPVITFSNLLEIFETSLYLPLNYLPSLLRQAPRLFIASFSPQYAHGYQLFAQFAQSASLIFDVIFNIPYRKAISRHPLMILRIFRNYFFYTSIICLLISTISLIISLFLESNAFFDVNIMLFPILISDSLLIAIYATFISYIFWSSDVKESLKYAFKLLFILLLCFIVFYFINYLNLVETILLVPYIISICTATSSLYIYIKKLNT